MKEAIVSAGPVVAIVDSAVPEPGEGQVLIRVVVSGSNPKDWKVPEWTGESKNEGDDLAGIVVRVGANVREFQPGDRVAAFHEMKTPHGSFAEYAIAWAHTTMHIPATTTMEAAAALPLAYMTAAIGLYADQRLPEPWIGAREPTPLIVYGAATAVGSYAVQLAARSNIHPIIAVAGSSAAHVETLLDRSRGDTIVDYRGGDEAAIAALRAAVGSQKVFHAFDAVADHHSNYIVSQALQPTGTINVVLPWVEHDNIPASIRRVRTFVGAVHGKHKDFGYIYSRYLTRALEQGWLRPQPHEVQPGGLAGIQDALARLKAGKAHAVKYVFRIADTEGAGQDVL
ncbi:groes-like alcohol dehydrogenase [Grosmannia clavigera kw1407]|uniref:Groes-like alcohol dehydrogenase n=1 Tax=Grosmannia clavigera (strain kw1407 / UAMH 11150) TaxID=655863 RepID=F0XMR3_GROCL|nr:groes-like alcohol dehydrogenase [Grosmannia clavigera kw1407]EFX01231.1 groes-like alcohol dehydrogenase [Grosmannia clavigera kw1407]